MNIPCYILFYIYAVLKWYVSMNCELKRVVAHLGWVVKKSTTGWVLIYTCWWYDFMEIQETNYITRSTIELEFVALALAG